jgi:hypothetical protein
MNELCTWEYKRHSYLVVYKDNNDVKYRYSPGENIDISAVESARDEFLDSNEFSLLENGFIDDRDSVKQLLHRVSLEFNVKSKYLYMYYSHKQDYDVPIVYDFTYKASSKVIEKLDFTVNPEEDFENREITDWNRVVEHDFRSSIISSLRWKDGLRIIYCYPITYHLFNKSGTPVDQDYISRQIDTKLKLYYPNGSRIMSDLFDITVDRTKVLSTNDEEKHEEISNIVKTATKAIDVINNSGYNETAHELNLKQSNPVKFGAHCNVLEVVIHVNYNENNMDFVDLKKLFYMLTTNKDMPYARYFYDGETSPKYKVYKGLVDASSDMFLPKEVLQDWINPKLNRISDRADVHEIHKELIKKIGNRGLSLKFVRPGEGERKYFTLNIYKNGRLDIKCHWDENYGDSDSPAGTAPLIEQALQKIIDFIKEMNKLQYHVPSQGKKKITPPKLFTDSENVNTSVAFYNTITTFDFGEIIDREDFMKYLSEFTNSHIVLVERKKVSGTDTRSFEFRYKRINNYLHIKSLHRSIKQYIEANNDSSANNNVPKKDIIEYIRKQYTLTEDEAKQAYASYETLYSLSGDLSSRRGRKTVISEYQISKILDRSIERKSAIDIKILKRNPKLDTDHRYKCLILGIDSKMLGRVIHFIKQVIIYYRYREQLSSIPFFSLPSIAEPDEDVEDGGVAPGQLSPPKGKRPKVNIFGVADSGSESESESESEDESGSESESEDEEGNAASVVPPDPQPLPKRSIIARSMLDILQERLPKIYKDDKASGSRYSSKCQKNTARQPLVVAPEVKGKIQAFITSKRKEVEEKLKATNLSDKDAIDLKLHSRELEIHQITLDEGADYNKSFFFCPLTWDWEDQYHAEDPDHNINLPRLAEAIGLSKDETWAQQSKNLKPNGQYHHSRISQWRNKGQSLKKYGTGKHDESLTSGEPEHPYYLSFIQDLGSAEDESCLACCFKSKQRKAVGRKDECLSKGQKKGIGLSTGSQGYILSDKHRVLDRGRLARISKKLNLIFNSNDPSEAGYKVAGSGTISPGFNFYLRRGVSSGNRFINAIKEITPKVNILDRLVEILTSGIGEEGPDEALQTFKSLKSGTLYHLFTPSEIDPAVIDAAETDEDLRNAIGNLSLSRFREYIESKKATINEDFLWDLLSLPGVILPKGLNIIICDVKITGRRAKVVETGTIKCPVGFEVSSLYDPDRSSIVLYKYENTYETVCKVQVNEKGNLTIEILFKDNHPLIDEIIGYVKTQCVHKENNTAKNELKRHINNVSIGNYRSDDYVKNFFHLPKVNKLETGIDVQPSEPINLNQAIDYIIKNEVEDSFKMIKQVIDSYNKVTHIIIESSTPDINRWIPVQTSGISLNNEEVEVISRQKAEEEPPDLLKFIEDMVFLKEYVNFDGYTPYGFLIDPGMDLDNSDDDEIIGVVLENGLITFTTKMLVSEFKDRADNIINVRHPTLKLDAVSFDMNRLLFSNATDQWFSDYKHAEQLLEKADTYQIDMRKAYTVRFSFENEVYQRLRYELSKELAKTEYSDVVDQIKGFLGMSDDLQGKRLNLEDTRKLIKDLIQPLIIGDSQGYEGLSVTEPQDGIEEFVGPIDKGFDELNQAEIKDGAYKYIKPYIRYECSNLENADKRKGDPHCNTTDPSKHKVYVPSINLVTGRKDNLTYYIDMIVEELLRMPLKRYQILDDEIDNLIIDYYVENDDEFYIDTQDEGELFDSMRNMYDSSVNYDEMMKTHYDVVSPNVRNTGLKISGDCNKRYSNLPKYWINLLGSVHFKIQRLDGPNNCFYEELNTIISKINSFRGNTVQVNTRYSISETIKQDDLFEDGSPRQGWERYRDLYSVLFPQIYKNVKTKSQLVDIIKNSERHKVTDTDLSIISRKYNIIFIILNQPRPRSTSGNGIACLGSTQVDKSKQVSYILLYLQGLVDFSIIADTSESPPKDFFTDEDFSSSAKFNMIHSKWVESCIDRDGKDVQDPASLIFRGAPQPVKTDTGHIRFTDDDGNLLTSVSQKKRAQFKKSPQGSPPKSPTGIPAKSPTIRQDLLFNLVQPPKMKPKFRTTQPVSQQSLPKAAVKKISAVLKAPSVATSKPKAGKKR